MKQKAYYMFDLNPARSWSYAKSVYVRREKKATKMEKLLWSFQWSAGQSSGFFEKSVEE